MNDLKIASVRANRYGPAPVGPKHGDPPRRQPPQRLRARMPVGILAHRDHRNLRAHGVEPGVARGPGRAVVAHLQDLRGHGLQAQDRLRREPRVTGEHGVEPAKAHAQNHRVLVGGEMRLDPGLRGVQDRQGDGIHHQRVTGPAGAPGHGRLVHRSEIVEIEGGAQGLPGLDHQVRGERLHQRGHASQVIGIAVAGNGDVEPLRTVAAQERQHHAPARVSRRSPGPTVYRDPPAVRRAQRDGVPLPHVQHIDRKAVGVPARGDGRQDRGDPGAGREHRRRARPKRPHVGPLTADPQRGQ